MKDARTFGLGFYFGPCDYGRTWGLRIMLGFWELVAHGSTPDSPRYWRAGRMLT